MNRRQALGRGAAVAIGVGVVVVGAAGYLAYVSTQGGTTTSTTSSSTLTTSSTTTPTTTTSSTASGYTSTFTGTYSGGTETTSDTYTYLWPTPSTQIQQDVWAFRPDLVQIGVNRFMEQMNENVKLSTISQDYFSVVTTKLLSGDLDLAYNTTDGAGTAYGAGLIHDMNDVNADYPTGRIMHGVNEIRDAINANSPSFVKAYTTLDGKHYYGLPYYQTNMGALMTNSKLTVAGGLEDATDYTKNSWPTSYADLYSQLPALQTKGIAQTPLLPGMWFTVFPGFGISQEFDAQMINIYGWNSLFTDPPNITPTFDTNTSVSDLLKQWKDLWDKNLVPHGIITMNSESDVNGLFGSGQFVYGLWISYDIRPMQNPANSKIAGFIHPVPGGKTGFGYLIQQGFIIRELSDPVYAERVHALATWMAYKDRVGVYYEPLRIAAEADIAGLTAYKDANTGPEIQSAFKDALVDSKNEVAVMANQVQTGAFFQAAPAPWANNWQIAVTDNVPSFLSGTQDLNTTITKMRSKADALVKGT